MHQSGKTYVHELDGMAFKMPVTFACLTIASISLAGIPPFAGFISKWNIAQSAFDCGQFLNQAGKGGYWLPYAGACVLLYSALMTAVYMFTVLVRAYVPRQGTITGAEVTDPNWMPIVVLV